MAHARNKPVEGRAQSRFRSTVGAEKTRNCSKSVFGFTENRRKK
jgi:hypothetical protein